MGTLKAPRREKPITADAVQAPVQDFAALLAELRAVELLPETSARIEEVCDAVESVAQQGRALSQAMQREVRGSVQSRSKDGLHDLGQTRDAHRAVHACALTSALSTLTQVVEVAVDDPAQASLVGSALEDALHAAANCAAARYVAARQGQRRARIGGIREEMVAAERMRGGRGAERHFGKWGAGGLSSVAVDAYTRWATGVGADVAEARRARTDEALEELKEAVALSFRSMFADGRGDRQLHTWHGNSVRGAFLRSGEALQARLPRLLTDLRLPVCKTCSVHLPPWYSTCLD